MSAAKIQAGLAWDVLAIFSLKGNCFCVGPYFPAVGGGETVSLLLCLEERFIVRPAKVCKDFRHTKRPFLQAAIDPSIFPIIKIPRRPSKMYFYYNNVQQAMNHSFLDTRHRCIQRECFGSCGG